MPKFTTVTLHRFREKLSIDSSLVAVVNDTAVKTFILALNK